MTKTKWYAKPIYVLVALVLVLSFSLVTAVPVVAGTTYSVDDDWQIGVPPYAEDTDGDTDFATIQAAIDAAISGDTINVAAGTYVERLVIDKQLTLQGAGSASTIIDATGGSPGIMLTAGGVSASQRLTIKGLTVKNSTPPIME